MRELPTPLPVEEALKSPCANINVPEGTALTLGPFEAEHYESFRLVEVASFEDLKRLGFLYKDLAEADAVKAIRADDRAYSESQRLQVRRYGSSCSCETPDNKNAAPIGRRHFQDHLIDLLQPHFRDLIRAGDPAVIHPYRHMRAWLSRSAHHLVGIFALQDINIGDNATLTMTPTVQAVHARDINIGKNGKFRFQSGNVHVRCKNLNGPSRFSGAAFAKHVRGLSREIREEGRS